MTTSPSAQQVQLPTPGSYRLDPARSSVAFATKHMFGLGGVTGSFAVREGDLVVGDPLSTTSVRAVIDAASFETGDAKRDDKVRSATFLDTASHPDLTFTATGIREADGGWVAAGALTVRGSSTPVEVRLTETTQADDSLTLVGHTRIDRYAHGVTKMKGMAGRWLDLTITAVTLPL